MKANNIECGSIMSLSSSVTYGAIIVDDHEVPITREMMSKACQQMDDLQVFPFSGRSRANADLKVI